MERMAAGERSAIPEMLSFEVSHDADGWCLFMIYNELKSAFNYEPGSMAALNLLLSITRKLQGYRTDNQGKLIAEPEWERLTHLRGPWGVEFLQVYHCPNCGRQEVHMGLSGMSYMSPLECPNCGNVYFQVIADEKVHPPCPCGGQFSLPSGQSKCYSCGTPYEKNAWKRVSLYQYFQDHKFFLAKAFQPDKNHALEPQ